MDDGAHSRYGTVARVALRKLLQLHAAERLSDLAVPPGNRLEALSGKRKGQYSIRVNDQGASVRSGRPAVLLMLKSAIIIETLTAPIA